nr:arabinogalactan endo-1,4-beta-galactosidase [Sphingomonas sp. PP-F2F-G114-C0414]
MRRIALGLVLLASTATAQPLAPKPASGLYLGADLSYVNEMENCGAVYRANGKPVDPFALMKAKGGNIVRVRIWKDAKWTNTAISPM